MLLQCLFCPLTYLVNLTLQITEAEAATLSQQKKIEELEAQLQEAEDIVRDLRDDLSEVQAELERRKTENPHHTVKPGNGYLVQVRAEDKNSSYESLEHLPPNKSCTAIDATAPYSDKINECRKCCTKIVCTCGTYIRNRDLPSIILRGKDPGVYINGCTQRIHACETGKEMEDKNEIDHNMQVRHSSDSEAPASGGEILSELEQMKVLAKINFGPYVHQKKRSNRRKKAYSLLQNPDHLAANLEAGEDYIRVNASAHCAENPADIGPRLSQSEAELKTQVDCREGSEGGPIIVENCDSTTQMDGGVNGKLVPLGLVDGISESLPNDSEKDVGKADVPSHSLESNSLDTTEGFSSRHMMERVFKYTFQRKRKRQALVVSEMNSSCATEKKIGDVNNVESKQEQPKPNLLKESSRDHRRLAQVARQVS